jgi:allantoinase
MTTHRLNHDGQHRDLVGYAGDPPNPRWPASARLAVNIIINYEEGAERALANGDDRAETHLLEDISLLSAQVGQRSLSAESVYEYGSRVGIWRLFRILQERNLRATVWAVGQAVEQNPLPVQAMAQAGFEIACHHYRWISYQQASEELEREHLKKAIAAIERAVGVRPVGFFHWCGPNTRRLLVEDGGFLYDSEAYNDDLPYWVKVGEKSHLVIPYVLDNNDYRYSHLSGWATGRDLFDYAKATFDQLYLEGIESPSLMTLALHARLSGRPGRARAVAEFLDYMVSHRDIWVCTRREVAEHWYRQHSPTPLK